MLNVHIICCGDCGDKGGNERRNFCQWSWKAGNAESSYSQWAISLESALILHNTL